MLVQSCVNTEGAPQGLVAHVTEEEIIEAMNGRSGRKQVKNQYNPLENNGLRDMRLRPEGPF